MGNPCYRCRDQGQAFMAIDASDLYFLLREAKDRPFAGSVLALGKQDITVGAPMFRRLAARVGFVPAQEPQGEPMTDSALFRALGFSESHSLDINAYEGAEVLHDLNSPDVPPNARGRYDVVFDRGTSEHVFHMPNMLTATARLTRTGGRVMHLSPSTNHLDHGFFMFTPQLFQAFYEANGFVVERLELVRYPWLDRRPTIASYRYDPARPCGRLDEAAYQVFCVVRKTPSATTDRIPVWCAPQAEGAKRTANGGRPMFPLAAQTAL